MSQRRWLRRHTYSHIDVVNGTCQLEGLLWQLEEGRLPPQLRGGPLLVGRSKSKWGRGVEAGECGGESGTESDGTVEEHRRAFELHTSQPAHQEESWSVNPDAKENSARGDRWLKHFAHLQVEPRAEQLVQVTMGQEI